MHAALLPTPTMSSVEPEDTGFMITMLDGGLGAVTAPSSSGALPVADAFCWCGCLICIVSPEPQMDAPQV
jgi:hypothetical protein